MTEKFFRRVMNEVVVDTKKYRYTYRGATKEVNGMLTQMLQIIRIKIEDLGTTAAIDGTGWEVVEERIA